LTLAIGFGTLAEPVGATTMDLEDTRPVKKPEIVIGEPLDLLSLAELEQRIAILESEIVRIRDTLARKSAGKAAADAIFRR